VLALSLALPSITHYSRKWLARSPPRPSTTFAAAATGATVDAAAAAAAAVETVVRLVEPAARGSI